MTDILEPEYYAPYARGSDTSAEAAAAMTRPDAETLCGQILALITDHAERGATCDEVEVLLNLSHQTCSARFWDLHKRDFIGDSGKRRRTRSDRNAVVWVLPKYVPPPVPLEDLPLPEPE